MDMTFSQDRSALVLGHSKGVLLTLDPMSMEIRGHLDTDAPPAKETKLFGRPSSERKEEIEAQVPMRLRTRYLDQEAVKIFFDQQKDSVRAVVCSVAASADGGQAACGTWEDAVHVWNARTRIETHRLHGHVNYVRALAFSPDGQSLASGGDDCILRVWDLPCAQVKLEHAHPDRIAALCFMPDGRTILSGACDMLARALDAHTGEELKVLSGHTGPVSSVAVSPDGHLAATGSDDKTVRVWDLASSLPWRRSPGHAARVCAISFAPNGKWFVSSAADATLRIWDEADGEEMLVLAGHTDAVTSVAVSPDSALLASVSNDSTLRIWEARTGRQLNAIRHKSSNLYGVCFAEDGRVIVEENHANLHVWDYRSEALVCSVPAYGTNYTCFALAPGGTVAAVATNEAAQLAVWDREQGREVIYHLRDPTIAGSLLSLWDLSDGRELKRLDWHGQAIQAIAFHPSGKEMASSSQDRSFVWRVGEDEPCARLEGISGGLDKLAYAPSGEKIYGGQENVDMVFVWRSEGGKPIQAISGYRLFEALLAWEASPNSLQAFVQGEETAVSRGPGAAPLAFFPASLTELTRHPSQPVWVGASGRHVHLIRCENV